MAKDRESALTAQQLDKTYRLDKHQIEVLRDLDLEVASGEWVALTGSSGCGKTTLLHLLGMLDRPDRGSVSYFGASAGHNPFRRARLRRRYLGFVFQSFQLFPELTALENVMLAGRLDGMSPGPCRERAAQLLARLGLGARLPHHPAELSGGEQQRVAVARALMNDPSIILADEPTGNLDPRNSGEIIDIFARLCRDEGKTIVMVSHDRKLAQRADRLLVLEGGRLQADP